MPRYDEMDDIVRRVRDRLVQGRPADVAPGLPFSAHATGRDDYAEAVELIMLALRHAQQLHEHLNPDAIHCITSDEHDDLVNLLGRVIRELQSCQAGLQGVISE